MRLPWVLAHCELRRQLHATFGIEAQSWWAKNANAVKDNRSELFFLQDWVAFRI